MPDAAALQGWDGTVTSFPLFDGTMSQRTIRIIIGVIAVAALGLAAYRMIWTGDEELSPSAKAALRDCEPEEPTSYGSIDYDVEPRLVPVWEHSSQLTALTFLPGDERPLVGARAGLIWRVDPDTGGAEVVLDLTDDTTHTNDQGILAMVVDDVGEWLYVLRTDLEGATVLSAFEVRDGEVAPEGTEILEIEQPDVRHNGGALGLDEDGLLYVGVGDGGDPLGDVPGNAQNPDVLLGKTLRIDPRPTEDPPYLIPDGNPYANSEEGQPEVWFTGLRNPFRLSFDEETDDLWITDSGERCWEEVTYIPADHEGGGNLGWDRLEGTHAFEGDPENPPEGYIAPIHEYGKDAGCTPIGGFVYHGSALPELSGAYLFADHCRGEILALRRADGEVDVDATGLSLSLPVAIVPDGAGEPWIVSIEGQVLRMLPGADQSGPDESS